MGTAELEGIDALAQRVARVVLRTRFNLSDEKATQQEMAEVLSAVGICFEREKHLGPGDIPDFMVSGGLAIEIKLKRSVSKMEIYRQLRRYALHQEVLGLLLITNVSMGLPPTIEGKPAYYASMGRAWL